MPESAPRRLPVIGNASTAPFSRRRPRLGVLLTAGQSNAGNHGEERLKPTADVYNLNIFDHGCYVAQDPLLGTTGDGGNLFTQLGQLLVERGVYDAVVLVPIAVGGSSVEDWAPGGTLNIRFSAAFEAMAAVCLSPSQDPLATGRGEYLAGTERDDARRHQIPIRDRNTRYRS